jgi:crotonobetainyl-CoA:carnitine CoA-transferase CaiB-like acyl-CoA transferase
MNPFADVGGTPPLDGITVLDLTQVLAGPMTTMLLGDLGAEVIKVEAPGHGDISRGWEPKPQYFDSLNRNKRSIAIDLKTEAGGRLVHRLVEDADVLVENLKPGRPEAFGLDYGSVRERSPRIVYCSIKGFGQGSPYEDLPAMDMIIQAMSGVMSVTGEADRSPLWSGLPSGDLAASMFATQSILAALFARERGHVESEYIEIPMLDSLLSWMSMRAAYSFKFDEPFPRTGTRHPTAEPFGVFECADGPIVALATTPTLWEGFCACLDRPDLLNDARFETNDLRIENRDALHAVLEPVFAERSAAEWLDRFHEHEVPAAPIHDTASVWEDPHVVGRGLRRTIERPDREDAEVVDNPMRFAHLDTSFRRAPPAVGEDTEAVLRSLGYDVDEIARLRREGAVE